MLTGGERFGHRHVGRTPCDNGGSSESDVSAVHGVSGAAATRRREEEARGRLPLRAFRERPGQHWASGPLALGRARQSDAVAMDHHMQGLVTAAPGKGYSTFHNGSPHPSPLVTHTPVQSLPSECGPDPVTRC